MSEKIIDFFKKNLLIFLILILATYLRSWNLVGLAHFTLDEELEAFIMKNIVSGYHFPAIGISVAPVGIHLSPLFYYLAAIPFALGKLNPISLNITASFLGVVTTLIIFKTYKEMFSQRVGLLASLFYASSFLMVLYDKHFWNLTPIPLVSVLTLYSLYQIINKKYWWTVVLSLALSVGISSHLSVVSLVILTLLVWWKDKLPVFKKPVLFSLIIIFLSQLPLLIFELRHQFYQFKTLLAFFQGEHNSINPSRIWENLLLLPKVFSRLIYIFGNHDFAREHTYGLGEIAARDSRIPLSILILVSLLLLFFFYLVWHKSLRNRREHAFKLQAAFLLISILNLVFYGFLFKGTLFEFYLSLLFPTLFLILALFVDFLWTRGKIYYTLVIILTGIFLITNIQATISSHHSYGLAQKIQMIKWVQLEIGNKDYELHSIGYSHKYEGYRYLFEYYYKPPLRSYVDPQLAWLYQQPVSSSPDLMVVISSKEDEDQDKIDQEENLYSLGKISEKSFGEMHVMIVNSVLLKGVNLSLHDNN